MALRFANKKKDEKSKKDELTQERMVAIYSGMLEGTQRGTMVLPLVSWAHRGRRHCFLV